MNTNSILKKMCELSLFDKLIEIVGIVLLIFYLYLIISAFPNLPENIPTHFGLDGIADSFGPKISILGLPIIGFLIYVSLTIASFNPQKYYSENNTTTRNVEEQYPSASKLFRIIKLSILILFIYIDWQTISIAFKNCGNLGSWFYLFVILLFFLPITYFSIKFLKTEK